MKPGRPAILIHTYLNVEKTKTVHFFRVLCRRWNYSVSCIEGFLFHTYPHPPNTHSLSLLKPEGGDWQTSKNFCRICSIWNQFLQLYVKIALSVLSWRLRMGPSVREFVILQLGLMCVCLKARCSPL